jgi:hypothetical protein
MNHILALWATPRSRSTSFERMMLERGDFITCHEPFGPYYYDQTRETRPVAIDPQFETQLESIVHHLQQQARDQRVFIKDFPWHIMPRVDEAFLSLFDHTFLIRHPAQMIASYLAGWPDVQEEELGYAELAQMFDCVQAYQGTPPIVIDADDLVADPAATVRAYCDAVHIPFVPEALSWKVERRPEYTYLEGGRWHENLHRSSGIQMQHHHYPTLENSPRLRELVQTVLPYYEKLHAVRLPITALY